VVGLKLEEALTSYRLFNTVIGFNTNPTLVRATAPATIFPWLESFGNVDDNDRAVAVVDPELAALAISGEVDGDGEGICREASDIELDIVEPGGRAEGMIVVGDWEKKPVCESPYRISDRR